MKGNLTITQVQEEIATAERKLIARDERASRLWDRVKVLPAVWEQEQYPGDDSFWVIAILGSHCLYFNPAEEGWGWGRFQDWGKIESYHWEQDEIQHTLFKTLFAIDNGGSC